MITRFLCALVALSFACGIRAQNISVLADASTGVLFRPTPGLVVPSGKSLTISSGGTLDVTGATLVGFGAGTGDLLSTNNLSDVASAATARANLGLGSASTPTFAGLGIGITAEEALHVAGSGTVVAKVRSSGAVGAGRAFAQLLRGTSGLETGWDFSSNLSLANDELTLRELTSGGSTTARMTVLPGGYFGIGTASPTATLHVARTSTATTQLIGMQGTFTLNPTGNSSPFHFGLANEVIIQAGNIRNFTGQIVSNYGSVQHFGTGTATAVYGASGEGFNSSSGTITVLGGVSSSANNVSTGTVTNARSIEATVVNSSTGTITNGVGVYINGGQNGGGGTLTTNIGLDIADQTAGGTNYAIRTGSGLVSFGGNVTAPNVAANTAFNPLNSATAYITSSTSPLIYSSSNSGSAPFDAAGHLILAPRISGASRDIIFHGGLGLLARFYGATGNADITGSLTLGTPLTVANGGTGRATGTTAYGLIAAGTTATGAQQTLAAGATTEVLVGGGASALPVWTTATGSGAPVRATSPTITTPIINTITSAASSDLTLAAGATNQSIVLDPSGTGGIVATETSVPSNLGLMQIALTSALTANAAKAAIYGSMTNSGSPTPGTGHGLGVLGAFADTSGKTLPGYGVEGRVDPRGSGSLYIGVASYADAQVSTFTGQALYGHAVAYQKLTTDGSTPLAEGTNVGFFVGSLTGGALKASFMGYDPLIIFGSTVGSYDAATGTKAATLSHDGTSGIVASTNSTPLVLTPANGALRLNGTTFAPASNDGAALGTTSLGWSDLHLATGALINVANGNWVFTHSSGIGTVSTGDLRVTTAGTNAASVVTLEGTQTLKTKTIDSADNVIKLKGYIYLTHPHLADGTGATINTTATSITYGHATFSNSADKAGNYVEYYIQVPEDIDTSVALRGRLKFLLGGADTNAQNWLVSSVSVADSAVPTSSTLANEIGLTYSGDASGANGDVETTAWTTLTSWAGALTAGQTWRIRLARDGDTSDASTVNSTELGLVIEYGVTQ